METEKILKNNRFIALIAVQTEMILKIVLIIVQQNINKSVLIPIH